MADDDAEDKSKRWVSVENVNFVGSESDSPAVILKKGHVVINYVPSENGITTESTNSGKTAVEVYGDVEIGSLSATIYLASINTADFFFPISYRFDFALKNGSTMDLSKKVKFMNGSSLTVENGATLNVKDSLAIYEEYNADSDEGFIENNGIVFGYPSGLGDAILTNCGTINVTDNAAIGGCVYVGESDASASGGAHIYYHSSIYSVQSPEFKGDMPNDSASSIVLNKLAPTTRTIDAVPNGMISNDGISFVDGETIRTRDYSSLKIGNNYGWSYETIPLESVSIQSVGDNVQTEDYGYQNLKASHSPDYLDVIYTWDFADGTDTTNLSFSSEGAGVTAAEGANVTIYNYSENEIASVEVCVTAKTDDSSITSSYTIDALEGKNVDNAGKDIDALNLIMNYPLPDGATENTLNAKYTAKDDTLSAFDLKACISNNYDSFNFVEKYAWAFRCSTAGDIGKAAIFVDGTEQTLENANGAGSDPLSSGSSKFKICYLPGSIGKSSIHFKTDGISLTAKRTFYLMAIVLYKNSNNEAIHKVSNIIQIVAK